MYYDLSSGNYIKERESKALSFLYKAAAGRCLLKLASSKFAANAAAAYMNSVLSQPRIKRFIKKNHIDMSEYEERKYRSFNDFFTRKIKSGKREPEDGFVAVCDSKLRIYKTNADRAFDIKGSLYTARELTGEEGRYEYALIFRLEPDDYHHFIYPDSGETLSFKEIAGKLNTVRPIAEKSRRIYHENSRRVSFLRCENAGDICYIEVGAMLIGKITDRHAARFKKGEEKGYFEFGGSTVVILTGGGIDFDGKILENTKNGIETIVKAGQRIGNYSEDRQIEKSV